MKDVLWTSSPTHGEAVVLLVMASTEGGGVSVWAETQPKERKSNMSIWSKSALTEGAVFWFCDLGYNVFS